ncbi:MAG: hypothetical protein Q8O33_03680 [Pseudomonadota bacterium]|nr:hypothetical protein [Pseudomonadota bacterium]
MKRAITALLILTLLAIQPVAAEWDAIADLRARAEKIREDQAKAREALSAIEGKARDLLNQRAEVATQLEKLKKEQIRVRGFQLWNAFVGSMGASFDALQKVNPGTQAFLAGATFVTDRVYDAMKTKGDMQARLNRLDDKVKSMSPKLRMLQKAYSMTPQEVADQLVARRMIENTWLQRWTDTPEKIAESKSVVTGKGTFILEAMGPAITELEGILSEMDGILQTLMAQTPGLRLETKRLPAELHDIERHIQLQEQLKQSAIPPLPEPATVDMKAAREYAAAGQEIVQSMQKLVSNQIGCQEHWNLMSAARNGAYRTNNERINKAYGNVARSCGGSSSEACKSAWAAFYNYASAEGKALRDALEAAQKTNNELIKSEREGPVRGFSKDLIALRNGTLFIRGKEHKFRDVAGSGEGLAHNIWGNVFWKQSWSLPIWTPSGGIHGAKKRYTDWLQRLEEAKKQLGDIDSLARDESGTASGMSAQAPRMAEELMRKRALWGCYHSDLDYGDNTSSPESDLRWLNGFDEMFQSTVEAGKQQAKDYLEMIDDALTRARVGADVMAGEEEVIRTATAAIETRRAAVAAYNPSQMDVAGTRVRDHLGYFKISHEGLRDLRQMIQEFADEKKLEAYARTLVWGEPTYDPKALHVFDRQGVEQLRKSMGQQAAAIQNAREAYQNARQRAEDAQRAFSGKLASMRSALQNVLPEQAVMLEDDKVYQDVLDRIRWAFMGSSNWYAFYDLYGHSFQNFSMADPADFGEPTFGLIPLMEQYTVVAEQYLALVNPMVENIKNAVREAKQIEAIAKRVAGNTGWAQLSQSSFSAQVDKVRKEVMEIYDPLQKQGRAGYGSPLDNALRAFNQAVGRLAAANSEYNAAQRLSARLGELSDRIARFLSGGGDIETGEALSVELRPEIASSGLAAAYAGRHGNVGAALSHLRGQEQPLVDWLAKARAEKAMKQTGAVQRFYEEFAQAYSSMNLSRLTRMMTSDWRADDADLIDLEDTLSNSFRVFDRVQFKVQGLSIQPSGPDRFEASYSATITGHINQLGLKHEETARVTDTVVNTPDGLKIQRTRGGRLWLQ